MVKVKMTKIYITNDCEVRADFDNGVQCGVMIPRSGGPEDIALALHLLANVILNDETLVDPNATF